MYSKSITINKKLVISEKVKALPIDKLFRSIRKVEWDEFEKAALEFDGVKRSESIEKGNTV